VNRLYPVFIKLEGRPSTVVGGGEVALRKVEALLEAGARVTVVSPALVPGLEALVRSGRVEWVARRYLPGDLAGAFLVIAALDDPRAAAEVEREADLRSILLNSVDDDPHSSFHVPATAARGDLKIAISTGGKSPALASLLRRRLESAIQNDLARFLAALGDLRPRVLARHAGDPERRKKILTALARSVRPSALPAPLPAGAAAPPGESGEPSAGPAAERGTKGGAEPGKVYLVGAGPGDPGLLTLRGAELLRTAGEVHYDRLVGPGVLALIPATTPRICVGKEVGSSDRPDTGELLVEAARAGKAVVRLKGGDPHVFGRGGEEMLALLKAEVPFEVVPGVSALNAVPAAAGIPLTFRGMAREVVVRSGYQMEEAAPAGFHGPAETTYVYLMTIGRLTEIVDQLLAEGLDPETPAAIIQRGTLPDEEVLVAPLGRLVARVARAGLRPPAMVIAGEVVRFVNWKENLRFLEAHLLGGSRESRD
jgi:uroporphyrin-III C-methyltransferase/precorrin-2 dehydrogenase/sirohydrochlorin ferrochelatase